MSFAIHSFTILLPWETLIDSGLICHIWCTGFYKISTHAYNRLQNYKIPTSWGDKIEAATLIMRGKAHKPDEPQMDLPMCYACSSPFPMTSSIAKDACGICSQPMFRSFITFDQLPLVYPQLYYHVINLQLCQAFNSFASLYLKCTFLTHTYHLCSLLTHFHILLGWSAYMN